MQQLVVVYEIKLSNEDFFVIKTELLSFQLRSRTNNKKSIKQTVKMHIDVTLSFLKSFSNLYMMLRYFYLLINKYDRGSC